MAGEGLPGGKPGNYRGVYDTKLPWGPGEYHGVYDTGKWSGIDNVSSKKFLNILNEAYEDLMRILFSRTGEFIEEMGKYWAAPVARDFFTKIFVPKINEMLQYCYATMGTVNSTVNHASSLWAKHNKSTWTNVAFVATNVALLAITSASINPIGIYFRLDDDVSGTKI